jgi:hypoxanthine phosphoribosyltransferase
LCYRGGSSFDQEFAHMPVVRGKVIEPLFTAEQIAGRNLSIAAEIATRPANDLLVIAILKGSFIFAADLLRALHDVGLAPEVEFITLSSYGVGTVSQGVRVVKDIDSDVKDRDVLLIDDILESGRTLRFAKEMLYERGARSVSIAVLLDKRVKRKEDLEADYVGFECPDYFVVGYGMDVAYAFRELPFVGVVKGDA